MIQQKPFTLRLKKEFLLNKLVAIESDLSKPSLGLNEKDTKTLIDNVSIIFHVAASVKFEAPLEVNMCHNVCATKSLLDLACSFKQLKCFIHVSTAYSNCQLKHIDERIYPMDVPQDPMSLEVTKEMIDNRPNTYTYTKAMAENVASQYASKINVIIVRPSIVMSSIEEPTEGWIDSINGPVGLSVLGALGILQKIKVNSEVVFDLIPVDIVTNALISIAWAATEKKQQFLPGSSPTLALPKSKHKESESQANAASGSSTKELINVNSACKTLSSTYDNNNCTNFRSLLKSINKPNNSSTSSIDNLDGTVRVFNLTTGSENPCSFYHYFSTGREEAYMKPSARALRPLLKIPKQKGMNPTQYFIHKIFSHLLFAYIVDTLLGLFGQKKMVIKAVNRMHHANEMFDFFCSNQWQFVTDNVKKLRTLQTDGDKEVFNSDVRTINWDSYARVGWMGCRRFILKEDDDTIDYAKQRYRIICLVYYLVKIALVISLTALLRSFITSPIAMSMILLPLYGIVYLL